MTTAQFLFYGFGWITPIFAQVIRNESRETMMSDKRIFSPRLIWLQTFLAVLEHRSVTAAATALCCSQSMATRNIKDLEYWLGRDLFKLITPVELSDEGREFEPVARQVVEAMYANRTNRQNDTRPEIAKKRPRRRIRPRQQPK